MKTARAFAVGLFFVATSAAADDRAEAKRAYDRGVRAHKRRDFQRAASEFAHADAIAPSAVALQAALDAALEADDPALALELAERSSRGAVPPALATSVANAHRRFDGRAGRLKVVCPSACTARLDGRPVDHDAIVWTKVGSHTVTVRVDSRNYLKQVEVAPEGIAEFTTAEGAETAESAESAEGAAERSPPEVAAVPVEVEPPRVRDARGLPPIYFYGAAGATIVLAGLTTIFALNASSHHDDFEKAGCVSANYPACQGLKNDGESSQTLTNISLALTLLAGAGAAVLGARFTSWQRPTLGLGPQGFAWSASF